MSLCLPLGSHYLSTSSSKKAVLGLMRLGRLHSHPMVVFSISLFWPTSPPGKNVAKAKRKRRRRKRRAIAVRPVEKSLRLNKLVDQQHHQWFWGQVRKTALILVSLQLMLSTLSKKTPAYLLRPIRDGPGVQLNTSVGKHTRDSCNAGTQVSPTPSSKNKL